MNPISGEVSALKTIRERLGWSKYRMAEQLGISYPSYKHLELKATGCQFGLLKKIRDLAARAGIDLNELWELLMVDAANKPRRARKGQDFEVKG